ncbi:DUF2827 domain-containing protein [Noviherbaspirillum galbum]|uniref:DUF2827 domain-containing protein n=1 Tax=Noviherbaspirillum galbum TaxID=2709383 RepID=A0A6B3SS81_9BURK|nr:DUF2827 domain-containing protein [Noviherbaspirillum galbum]NEX61666.1 DUF2827 domain-containing protein [Noviherbaspirillum galbum]
MLRIGITVGLRQDESLWNNGIKQNALFLADTLRRCPNVGSVRLVNTTDVPLPASLPWDASRWPVFPLNDLIHELDVVIELGGQLSADQTEALKSRGARLVSYCCGSEYVLAMEAMLFNRPLWGDRLFINQCYDAIWIIPQVDALNRDFFQTLRRRPATVVPFVWSPVLLEERCAALPHRGVYQPRPGPRRLSVMEPNIDVLKFCLYPLLIAEEAYRRRPDRITGVQVANALSMAQENRDFIALMHHLDLVREHKAVFTGRHDTPQFLSEHTDIMISHQWGNPLNYFYLEVCWLGYPLVHNAGLCADLGYYYAGHDVQTGCERLLEALENHDAGWEEYRALQRRVMSRYLPSDPKLVGRYAALLDAVVSRGAD